MRIVKMVILAIVLLVLWIALGVVMFHIPSTDAISEAGLSDKRFKTIHVEGMDNASSGVLYILEDTSTGDKYLVVNNGEGLGITHMVDKEASK